MFMSGGMHVHAMGVLMEVREYNLRYQSLLPTLFGTGSLVFPY